MKTKFEAENIIDSILLAENGSDDFVCIPWYTKDLEYGWLTISNLKSYRDSKDETKKRQRYGGTNFIVDKAGGIIWEIPAAFHLIENEVRKYRLVKEYRVDNLIVDGNLKGKEVEEYDELLEFCTESSYNKEFRNAMKLFLTGMKEDPLVDKNRLSELIEKLK